MREVTGAERTPTNEENEGRVVREVLEVRKVMEVKRI